jgi:hypothetical protein
MSFNVSLALFTPAHFLAWKKYLLRAKRKTLSFSDLRALKQFFKFIDPKKSSINIWLHKKNIKAFLKEQTTTNANAILAIERGPDFYSIDENECLELNLTDTKSWPKKIKHYIGKFPKIYRALMLKNVFCSLFKKIPTKLECCSGQEKDKVSVENKNNAIALSLNYIFKKRNYRDILLKDNSLLITLLKFNQPFFNDEIINDNQLLRSLAKKIVPWLEENRSCDDLLDEICKLVKNKPLFEKLIDREDFRRIFVGFLAQHWALFLQLPFLKAIHPTLKAHELFQKELQQSAWIGQSPTEKLAGQAASLCDQQGMPLSICFFKKLAAIEISNEKNFRSLVNKKILSLLKFNDPAIDSALSPLNELYCCISKDLPSDQSSSLSNARKNNNSMTQKIRVLLNIDHTFYNNTPSSPVNNEPTSSPTADGKPPLFPSSLEIKSSRPTPIKAPRSRSNSTSSSTYSALSSIASLRSASQEKSPPRKLSFDTPKDNQAMTQQRNRSASFSSPPKKQNEYEFIKYMNDRLAHQ